MSAAAARARRAAPAALAAVAAAAISLSLGPPRVVLTNAALEVRRPWPQVAGLVGAGLALAAAAHVARARGVRRLLLAAALAVAALAADRAAFRVRLDDQQIGSRGLFGSAAVAWPEVTRVEAGSSAIVVWGRGERQVRVSTGPYREDQRATLERSIARHVSEAGRREAASPGRAAGP